MAKIIDFQKAKQDRYFANLMLNTIRGNRLNVQRLADGMEKALRSVDAEKAYLIYLAWYERINK
jgi:hypothetical protein